jgi:glycosyltransferase involved in cell wall biosynthesis
MLRGSGLDSLTQDFDTPETASIRVAVISDAAPARNGVGAYYSDLVEQLNEYVAHAELISPTVKDGVWEGGFMLPLPGDSTQKLCVPSIRGLARRVDDVKPNVVIIPTPGPYGLIGSQIAKRHNASVIIGYHTHFEKIMSLYWNRIRIIAAVTRGYFEVCNRILFKQGKMVLANSQEMASVAQRMGAPAVELMGTPIPKSFITDPIVPMNSEIKRVLFAGRLAAEKNIEAFLDAAKDLPDIEFIIAGDGPMRDEVRKRVNKLPNTRLLGWIPRTEMQAILDSIDVLVLPSLVESFGTIAMEAMARERMVLVSHGCGILEWPDLSRGLFVIREDETVTQALGRIADLDHSVRKKKAQRGRIAAKQLNDWTIKTWLDLLRRGVEGEIDKL